MKAPLPAADLSLVGKPPKSKRALQQEANARAASMQLSLFDHDGEPAELAIAVNALQEIAAQVQTATPMTQVRDEPVSGSRMGAAVAPSIDFERFMRAANGPAPTEVAAPKPRSRKSAAQPAPQFETEDTRSEEPEDIFDDVDAGAADDAAEESNAFEAGDTTGADSTTLHLARVSKRSTPLTPERETELGLQAMAGNIQARNELVERNMRFMISMARSYIKTGRPFDDIMQAGTLGLITAADKFDPSKGRFTTVAAWWIRQSIQRGIHADDVMPFPGHWYGEAARLDRLAEAAPTEAGKESLKKLSRRASDRLDSAKKNRVTSLNQTVGGDDESATELMSLVASEDVGQEERLAQHQMVRQLLEQADRLHDDRARDIFLLRLGMHEDSLGDAMTLGELAERFDISKEGARQIYIGAATDIATAMEFWAKGAENLPAGFREGLLNPKQSSNLR
jgi:RNA polymerase sigma factor (sigma-70 family)